MHPSRSRTSSILGTLAVVVAGLALVVGAPAANAAGSADIKINEIQSAPTDFVELVNTGSGSVDISGYKFKDDTDGHAFQVVPDGTVMTAGAHLSISSTVNGLGKGDSVRLYGPDGLTLLDSTTWPANTHATTWGRCPDGTGGFGVTTATLGAPNACASPSTAVKINEVESNGDPVGDWVELKNISGTEASIGGWVFKDDDDTDSYTIPTGTVVPAGGYKVLDVSDFVFGLGGADSARLYDSSAQLIDAYSWTAHATQTYGRCKDGLGDFVDTKAPTKGAANSCPGLDTQPWPGGQTVTYADSADTFVQDLSGLVFDPRDPDVLWGAQNKKGTLFKLVRDANDNWVPADGWPRDPTFANGQGAPDTEGITVGGDGFVYETTERDNDASGVSRNTILRFDPNSPARATITPTTEWNLTPLLPAAGANLGLEGVTYVPDSYLTGNAFKDQSTGLTYDPANYPLHGKGLFFVAYENNGKVYGFALDSNGVAHLVATIDSGFAALADLDFDPELQRLRAVTDDTFDGKTSLLKIDASGSFVVETAYDRPLGMPNLNNEGLAVAPQSRCVNGTKEVLWSDDGDTDSHSIRRGTISCTPPAAQTVTFSSPAPRGVVVGDTYTPIVTGGGSGNPVVLSVDALSLGVCSTSGNLVHFDHPGSCTVRADQAAGQGYAAGSAIQAVTVGKAPQSITFAQPGDTVYGGANVPLTVGSDSGLPVTLTSTTPAVCSVSGTTAVPRAAGACTITASQPGDGNRLPATPVSRSLTVAKAPVVVTTRSTSGLLSLLTLKITYTSTVRSAVTGLPAPGVVVTTKIVGGSATSGCTATTNASGVATCTVRPSIALGVHFTATAAESANHLRGTATAFIGFF
jgi:hypothetical protein